MELCMSQKERDRLRVLHDLSEGRVKQREAGALMGLSVRQVRRILRRYEALGDAGVVHGLRNRRSNRKIPRRRRPTRTLKQLVEALESVP